MLRRTYVRSGGAGKTISGLRSVKPFFTGKTDVSPAPKSHRDGSRGTGLYSSTSRDCSKQLRHSHMRVVGRILIWVYPSDAPPLLSGGYGLLCPSARKRIVAAQKKRWAAYRKSGAGAAK